MEAGKEELHGEWKRLGFAKGRDSMPDAAHAAGQKKRICSGANAAGSGGTRRHLPGKSFGVRQSWSRRKPRKGLSRKKGNGRFRSPPANKAVHPFFNRADSGGLSFFFRGGAGRPGGPGAGETAGLQPWSDFSPAPHMEISASEVFPWSSQ